MMDHDTNVDLKLAHARNSLIVENISLTEARDFIFKLEHTVELVHCLSEVEATQACLSRLSYGNFACVSEWMASRVATSVADATGHR